MHLITAGAAEFMGWDFCRESLQNPQSDQNVKPTSTLRVEARYIS